MPVFSSPEFADHEQVVLATESESGLRAIVAVHSTVLGPAIGGCRIMPYVSEEAALTDALRLSQGMSLKAAVSGVPFGGGKMVVIADPATEKTPRLLQAAGRAIDRLGGRYITGEDVGTTVEDMAEIKTATDHVMGFPEHLGGSGDPSPRTALGCFVGIEASVRHRLGRDRLAGTRVAVQGLGNVGHHLCRLLAAAGAELVVSDVDEARVDAIVNDLAATRVRPDDIYEEKVDVFAPCALGAVLNDRTVPALNASVVAGGANNQLADEARHAAMLADRDILYAPDFVINAGGMIQLAAERTHLDWTDVNRRVREIGATLIEIYERAEQTGSTTATAARDQARRRIDAARLAQDTRA